MFTHIYLNMDVLKLIYLNYAAIPEHVVYERVIVALNGVACHQCTCKFNNKLNSCKDDQRL